MKEYFRVIISHISASVSAYLVYYALLLSDIVSYYELASETDNLQAYSTIVILFLLFNFLYGYIFNYPIIKGALFQGAYLLLSGILCVIFPDNEIVEGFGIFNVIMDNLYGVAGEINVSVKILVFLLSVLLPIMFSAMGKILSDRIKSKKS